MIAVGSTVMSARAYAESSLQMVFRKRTAASFWHRVRASPPRPHLTTTSILAPVPLHTLPPNPPIH